MKMNNQSDGALLCARYSFRPNKLNYCGPDQNKELLEYINSGLPSEALMKDGGLEEILKKFETLFPYLKLIAGANKLESFEKKVVESYWVGNNLLNQVAPAKLFYHLADGLELKKKLPASDIRITAEKMAQGANPHHSFHVFNIWKRTGFMESPHTVYTMDECRIGWGKVEKIEGKIVTASYRPIVYKNHLLAFGEIAAKNIFYELNDKKISAGDWISFHWSSFCDVLNKQQVENLKYWTTLNLELANYENSRK